MACARDVHEYFFSSVIRLTRFYRSLITLRYIFHYIFVISRRCRCVPFNGSLVAFKPIANNYRLVADLPTSRSHYRARLMCISFNLCIYINPFRIHFLIAF